MEDVTTRVTPTQLLDNVGLNWDVRKDPLYTGDSVLAPACAVRRNDNDGIVGVVTPSYEPFQNSELAEIVLGMAEGLGIQSERGGQLKDGAMVYIQLRTGDRDNPGGGGGLITNHITALNAHNGTRAIAFGNTNVVVVCGNTFNMAYKKLEHKFHHTRNVRKRIEVALQIGELLIQREEEIHRSFQRFASVEIDPSLLAELTSEVVGVDGTLTREEIVANYDTYWVNKYDKFMGAINKELALEGPTAWGLFNGITNYTNHVKSVPKRTNARQEALLVGSAAKINEMAFHTINRSIS